MGVDPLTFVLTGGDDYGLVATFPPTPTLPQHLAGRSDGCSTAGETGAVTVDGAPYDDVGRPPALPLMEPAE